MKYLLASIYGCHVTAGSPGEHTGDYEQPTFSFLSSFLTNKVALNVHIKWSDQ